MLRHTVPSQAAGGGGRRGGGGEDVLFLHVLLSPPSVRASERARDATAGRTKRGPRTDRTEARYLSLARSLSFILARSLSLLLSLPPSGTSCFRIRTCGHSARSLARSLVLSPPPLLSGSRNARLETPLAAVGRASGSQNRLNPDKRRSNIHMENAILGAQQFYN